MHVWVSIRWTRMGEKNRKLSWCSGKLQARSKCNESCLLFKLIVSCEICYFHETVVYIYIYIQSPTHIIIIYPLVTCQLFEYYVFKVDSHACEIKTVHHQIKQPTDVCLKSSAKNSRYHFSRATWCFERASMEMFRVRLCLVIALMDFANTF